MRKTSLFAAAVGALVLIGIGTWIGVRTLTPTDACWFERQTISDDDGCEGSAYFAL
jgi:hypothetical protein